MSHSTLDAEYLTDLTPEQRGYLWEYYLLTTSSLVASEKELDLLSAIWDAAENDSVLTKWLSLIDYFYTNVPFSYEVDDDDRRAYLSEYIGLLADEQPGKTNAHVPNEFNEDALCVGAQEGYCVLICPDGSGYVRRSLKEMDSLNANERENWSCDRCKGNLIEHKISCTETPVH